MYFASCLSINYVVAEENFLGFRSSFLRCLLVEGSGSPPTDELPPEVLVFRRRRPLSRESHCLLWPPRQRAQRRRHRSPRSRAKRRRRLRFARSLNLARRQPPRLSYPPHDQRERLLDIHRVARARLHEAAAALARPLEADLRRHRALRLQIALVSRDDLDGLHVGLVARALPRLLARLALHVD